MIDWDKYYKKHNNRKPREQLVKAVEYCFNRRNALDIGAGNLIESKYLLENGFKHVVALDSSSKVLNYINNADKKKLNVIIVKFNNYKFPKNKFNLINAQFSLPFYGKVGFNFFINKIIESLKPNGIFVGQLFGIKDSWNTQNSNLVFHTKEEILNLFHELKILELIEEEKDDSSVNNPLKHWHIFNFIVKK